MEVKDALAAFVVIMQRLHGRPEPPPHGIDAAAFVHPSAVMGTDASVLPFASVGEGSVIGARCRMYSGVVVGRNCRIGDDVTLYPHVVLYDDTVLGDRVIVHANAVIGADGFGYRMQDGRHLKMPQFGCVEIGDDVEIGAGRRSIAARSRPRASGPAPRSTISCRSATTARSAGTTCS